MDSFSVTIDDIVSCNSVLFQVLPEHEGWVECKADGALGDVAHTRAFVTVRDLCAAHTCSDHQICEPDPYTDSYSCTCNFPCTDDVTAPSDDVTEGPVCASDCMTYSSACEMKRRACEQGLVGVEVVRYGECDLRDGIRSPEFVLEQADSVFKAGDSVILRVHAVATPDPVYR